MAEQSLVAESNFLDGSASDLLDRLEYRLEATYPIEEGSPRGGVQSLEDQPGGPRIVGTTRYESSAHNMSDIDAWASVANKRLLADEARDTARPPMIHIVAEFGDRYRGSTGTYGLNGLARLSVAAAFLAANRGNIQAQAVFVADGNRPRVMEAERQQFDDVLALGQYDRYVSEAQQPDNKPQAARDSAKALSTGLNRLLSDENLDTSSDVCFVISDFVMGAQRDKSGHVTGFNWQGPLAALADEMGDRLLVTRLMTPAQRQFSAAMSVDHGGRHITFDTDEYVKMSYLYGRSQQKAERIRQVLSGMRVLELDSNIAVPTTAVADFVFGEPEAL